MADKSHIEWTDATWNPITGCSPVSEGCENCYAKRHAKRFRGRFGYPEDDPFRVTFHEDRLDQPLRWTKPRKIFVCSMGDLFHEDVELEWLYKIFAVIAQCPHHRFLVLTKRPERMRMFFYTPIPVPGHEGYYIKRNGKFLEVFSHVWLGVTAENQRTAGARIPILLSTPAAVRFVSVEPMLGPIYLPKVGCLSLNRKSFNSAGYTDSLDWVICGGESGPGARPMHPDWARDLRDQCTRTETPFFFKQWGEWLPFDQALPEQRESCVQSRGSIAGNGDSGDVGHWLKTGKKRAKRLLDGREWSEWPEVSKEMSSCGC